MDPFKNQKYEIYQSQDEIPDNGFPDFNSQWMPPIEEGIRSKIGKTIEKGTDVLKKASHFYFCGIALMALLILLPPIFRLVYELSSWAFDLVGNIFK